jgi:hypothetical protein
MGKSEQARSYSAEGIVWELLEQNGVKITRLRIGVKGKGYILNEDALKLFLQIYSKNEKLISLLKELDSKNLLLPDFLCLNPKTGEPFFHEVKSDKRKLKLSEIQEKEAIKILGKNGYSVHITNVKFGYKLNEKEEDMTFSNKEQGKIMTGEIIPKNKKVKLKIRLNDIKETSSKNVYIEELEVTDNIS